MSGTHSSSSPGGGGGFQTTRWSQVVAAGDSANPACREALAQLCKVYWPAVYAFVRRRGNDPDASRDLTQGFFTKLLDKKYLRDLRQDRGRFRSFLLACVKHYLANEWDREQALKRGGGQVFLAIDGDTAESLCRFEPADGRTPETEFEKRWALTLLEQVLSRLEEETHRSDHAERFRLFKPFLTGDASGTSYKQVGDRLDMTESAVKVAVHRLRRRFGTLLREEVGQTVKDPALVEEEIRFLFTSLGA